MSKMTDNFGRVNGIYYSDFDIVFDYDQYEIIEAGYNRDLEISTYVNEDLTASQMKEIYLGLLENVDVRKYNKPEYSCEKMSIMRMFLKQGYDFSNYTSHSSKQMVEIYKGLKSNIDVSLYDSIKFNHHQMRIIRVGLERGIDMTQLLNPEIDPARMVTLRMALEKGMDISKYLTMDESFEKFYWEINTDAQEAGKGQIVRVSRYHYTHYCD